MKSSLRAGSILTVLALSIVGCDPAEPKSEGPPAHEEHATSKHEEPTPEAPVVPSSAVSLPSPLKSERDAAAKKEEAKAAEKGKEEPKHETPK